MRSESVEISLPPQAVSLCDRGCLFLIGSDLCRPGALTIPALTALAAADAVLHSSNVDPSILALVPRSAFTEAVPSDSEQMRANGAGIARARKLVSEGWRVVWIISGDAGRPAVECAEAGLAVHTCTGRSPCEAQTIFDNAYRPRTLATPFNGLAG